MKNHSSRIPIVKRVNVKLNGLRKHQKSITVLIITAMFFSSYFFVAPISGANIPGLGNSVTTNVNLAPSILNYQEYTAVNATYSFSINIHQNFNKVTVYFGDGNSTSYSQTSGTTVTVSHVYRHSGQYYIWYTVYYSTGTFTSINSMIPVQVIDTTISAASSIGILISMNSKYLAQPGNNISLFVGYISQPLNGSYTIYKQQLTVKKSGVSGSYSKLSTKIYSYTFNSGNYYLPYSSSFYNMTSAASGFYQLLLTSSTAIVNHTSGTVVGPIRSTISIYDVVVNQTLGTIDLLTNQTVSNAESSPGTNLLDPQVSYTTPGGELLLNTMETLYGYQGSNTSSLYPELASSFPVVGNGINSQSITRNITVYLHGSYVKRNVMYAPGQVYNFTLRSNATWQDGTQVTAWDAGFSIIRDILFTPLPSGTPGWILAQRLLPGNEYQSNTYQNITNNVTWDNATRNLTLYFQSPLTPSYVCILLASAGTYVSDANWMYQHGEGLQFTPAGFQSYLNQNMNQNYNSYVNSHIMSDGQYIMQYNSMDNRIILGPNPSYKPPAAYNGTEWAPLPTYKYVDLTYFSNTTMQETYLTSGNAQIASINLLPYGIKPKTISQLNLTQNTIQTLTLFWLNFNMNVNLSNLYQFDNNANLPPTLFDNLYVRLAFAYAFDDKLAINKILNGVSGNLTLGRQYAGIIPAGMPGYQNITELNKTGVTSGVPYYNMIMAKTYWNDFLNSSVNLNTYKISNGYYNGNPLNVPLCFYFGAGISVALLSWSQNLTNMVFGSNVPSGGGFPALSLNLTAFSNVYNNNPFPIYWYGWAPDYPYPDDYLGPMANPYSSEIYPNINTFTIQWFNNSNNPARNTTEVNIMTNMSAEFYNALNSNNETKQLMYFDQMNHNLVNMSIYIPLYQENVVYTFSNNINNSKFLSRENNPMIVGNSAILYGDIKYNTYSVIVSESGLPTGNQWFVNLTGASSVSGTGTSIVMDLTNGTYSYTFGTTNNSYFAPSGGTFTVSGHSINLNVKFIGKIPYSVTFTETGLISTAKWYVNVTGKQSSGPISTSTYSVQLVNGTYSYTIATTDKRYEPTSHLATLTVNGGTLSESVTFTELMFGVTFTESGLPSGTSWDVTILGNTVKTISSSISFNEPNGTYIYSVSGASGYSTQSPGAFSISGSGKAVPVPFVKNATLKVDVKTPGATFTVDGKLIPLSSGTATVSLAPGEHFLNATEVGYYTYTNLTHFSSSLYYLNITLTPLLQYGYLVGNVTPGYAFISASGLVIPVTSGKFDQSLSPGQYLVSAEASGYASHDYIVNITKSKTTYLNIALKKANLSYVISGQVSPHNASIMFGTYVAYVNSTGYYDISLPQGKYSYSITDSGYFPSTGNISITSNLVINFKLIAEPPPQSVKVANNITASGYNVTISNLTTGNGNISITYTAAANGTLVVMLPYSQVQNATISNIMNSKVYINGTQYTNFTVALSSINGTFSVILTVYGLKGDPFLEWAYSPSAHVAPAPPPPTSNPPPAPKPFTFGTIQIIVVAVAVALAVAIVVVGMRRRNI